MIEQDTTGGHSAYLNILASRGLSKGIDKDKPFWKIRLTDLEYESLKETLIEHQDELYKYGMEAALCYAEWWRRDYAGNIPSKEEVAAGINLPRRYSDDLYMAARSALDKRGVNFIRSQKGTEYFRTLLNQGGLPVNYIKNNKGNFSSFTWFLKGLVSELSVINYDWEEDDHSIIQQLNCISYLGKSFKNDNIYDVAMQIAHAIIMDDTKLLPYDDTDASLHELTGSLRKEYQRSKREHRARPLSLHWKLSTDNEGHGNLFVNMDVVKDISSDSIPGINTSTCYSFDVLVAGTFVGKYARKSVNRNDDGDVVNVTYTRISMGINKDILWHGEPVVEVKIRCDNDDRIFLTISGCYPPNFEHPQVFQMLDDNLYSKSETANAEKNIAVFTSQWECDEMRSIQINGQDLKYTEFSDFVQIKEITSGEMVNLTNKFTPYTAEFSGNYISWVEKSNYKLLTKIPTIRVYDKDKNRISNEKKKYRIRSNSDNKWHNLNTACNLGTGLVDIRVEFPDGHYCTETFYAIGDLSFISSNEQIFSTEITCLCDESMHPQIENLDGADVTNLAANKWKISRSKEATTCPSVCDFKILSKGNPTLSLSVAIPFDGVTITDVRGNIIPNKKIISFANLAYFCITSHGTKNRSVDVSYISGKSDDDGTKVKHLKNNVIDGIVSLSDYSDLIERMFNLYGANTFSRSCSVVLSVCGHEIYIRKFVLDSCILNGKIFLKDDTEDNTEQFHYEDEIYAIPVAEDIKPDDFHPIKLIRQSDDDNIFTLPEDYPYKEIVIFSGPEARRRIVPKYYNVDEMEFGVKARSTHSSQVTSNWSDVLKKEDVMMGTHWLIACKAFEICSRYNLPFPTHNAFKAIVRDPKLLAKFVMAMWINEYKEVLCQDIERFEQEMVIALHWIPTSIWSECINELLESNPALQYMIVHKMNDLVVLLQDLFNSTLSTDIAQQFALYIISNELDAGIAFTRSDINNYKMKIHGLSDNNMDLPLVRHQLSRNYYPQQEMPASYRVMIESALCAAENACGLKARKYLFSAEAKEHARVINFYRKYFKETYSEIFFRTIKLIQNK